MADLITLPRETVQQAIDAMEAIQNANCNSGIWATCEFHKEALRTALEAPAAREHEQIAREIGLWAEPLAPHGSSKSHNEKVLKFAAVLTGIGTQRGGV